jgi:hypothetical protein
VSKRTETAVVCAFVVLLAGGAGATWMLRDRLSHKPPPHAARGDYDAMVERLGGNEPDVRAELNLLAATASAQRDAADRVRANALTRECLDPSTLLDIGHVQTFVVAAARGEADPYHFVSEGQRKRLEEIAGKDPTLDRVLDVRKALARLAGEFEVIRFPRDWHAEITQFKGNKPLLPFLDLLKDGPEFMPAGHQPTLPAAPRIPAFAGVDGELLDQLERFFNGTRARAAFPPAKFPKLYRDGRIPPIPTALGEYIAEIEKGVIAEKQELVQVGDPLRVEAVNDVYAKLDRFLSAVIRFGQEDPANQLTRPEE